MNIYKLQAYAQPETKIWVFFDEFNTSSSLGIICEILCERTLLGETLPENMRFLAACNPYKLRAQKMIPENNVGLTRKQTNANNSKLAYHVYPLPESIIEYVWDFGALTESDYIKYVEQMMLHNFI